MDTAPLSAVGSLSEAERAEFWATLALRHTERLGARSIRRLLRHFGSALAAIEQVQQWPEATVSSHRGASLSSGTWRITAKSEWEAAKSLPGRIILWSSPEYPELLRGVPDAPALLYAIGDTSLLSGPCVAVVGKRQCSPDGLRTTSHLAGQLAGAGVTVVSGMALGVDQAAHRSALAHPGKTIAVLGTGVDVIYPASAAALYHTLCEQGLVVSEFPPETPGNRRNFPIRNRIISGLCLGVLVTEAALRSGSLITARLALEQNRSVYAVPGAYGAPTAQGCQELIRQGAKPAFDVLDILLDLFPQLMDTVTPSPSREYVSSPSVPPVPSPVPPVQSPPPQQVSFPPGSPEEHVFEMLRTVGTGVSIDVLDDRLELPAAQLSSLLVRLEVKGIIRKLPGNYYALHESSHAD